MNQFVVTTSAILLLIACRSINTDEIRGFLPGTYVRFSDHEMRTQYDTLKIALLSQAGNTYSVICSFSFQKKLDGKQFAWESRKEKWIAVYDEGKKVLNEVRNGKVISVAPEKKTLFVGTTEYKKIN